MGNRHSCKTGSAAMAIEPPAVDIYDGARPPRYNEAVPEVQRPRPPPDEVAQRRVRHLTEIYWLAVRNNDAVHAARVACALRPYVQCAPDVGQLNQEEMMVLMDPILWYGLRDHLVVNGTCGLEVVRRA